MPVIDTPEKLLYSLAGAALLWLGSIIKSKISASTEKRRAEVDEMASLRTENRKLKESLHSHRVLMLQTGQWTNETLPAFMKE